MKANDFGWNGNMELTHGKDVLTKSNLVDLLCYLTANMPPKRLNLIGLSRVCAILGNNNAPLSVFGRVAKNHVLKGIDEVDRCDVGGFKWTSFEKYQKML